MQDIITRLRAKKDDDGFTLIELLVVVVIIGVLVAIAVPVYLNYRQGAADKSAQSDVRGAISAVEQWYTDNNNTYPAGPTAKQSTTYNLSTTTAAGAAGAAGKVTLSDKTEMVYIPPSGTVTSYKLCATNTGGSGKYYIYDSASGGSVKSATTITATNFTTCGP
ncbi:prepilin-type N-terminal cleavage/methylation domain-containing protein [Actinoplanes sp. NPDC051470]|uniref:prepilin-type N-terminal cleavage/methylation domain-containing protein n=1 Tax=unclassified Actinoplanes TaxID=2626549 RepID=UPI00343CD1B4